MKSSQNQPEGSFLALRRPIPRRRLLQGMGVALGLPLLNAMRPAFAAEKVQTAERPRRMLTICNNLGFLSKGFFPAESGKDYEISQSLAVFHIRMWTAATHPRSAF